MVEPSRIVVLEIWKSVAFSNWSIKDIVKLLNVLNPVGSSAMIPSSKEVGSDSKSRGREVRTVPLVSTEKKF